MLIKGASEQIVEGSISRWWTRRSASVFHKGFNCLHGCTHVHYLKTMDVPKLMCFIEWYVLLHNETYAASVRLYFHIFTHHISEYSINIFSVPTVWRSRK